MTSFRTGCEDVLRRNDRGRYTVPSPSLYPHQWAWDSAFIAIGWVHLDPERAWTEIDTLLSAQWPDGRIPHIVFHELGGDYFPTPEFWGTTRTSSITQPPLWATAVRRIVEVAGTPPDGLSARVARIDASHRFFHEARDPSGWGAVCVAHPWESGLDNCPAFDGPLSRVDVSHPPAFRRRDRDVVGDASVRPTDEQYVRFAVLVKEIAAAGFGLGSFAVYDPFVTACLVRAEDDLAALAERAGVASSAAERANRLRRGLVDHLWDEGLGRFVYVDARTAERIACDVIGGYAPLWAGVDGPIAARLREGLASRYGTRWPLPSTAPSDPAFDPRRYWRGPTWINVDWMLTEAVGPDLAARAVELVREGGMREYFHPETAEGLGARDFAWTAALALDLSSRA